MIRRGAIVALLCGLAAGVALASSGVVLDPEGKPIEDVKVCAEAGGVQQLCVYSDAEGAWSLPLRDEVHVRLTHREYLPKSVPGGDPAEPVTLQRGAALTVRLEDASGRPLSQGHVDVLLASGKRFGPFPIVNEAGTQINSLDAGPVVILARSKGFVDKRDEQSKLVAGEKTVVVLRLEPEDSDQ